jgi:hypothetical protein
MDPKGGKKIPETEPNVIRHQVEESKEENDKRNSSKEENFEKNRSTGDVEMEAEITSEDVEKAGGVSTGDVEMEAETRLVLSFC